jgi:Zn finger protein HypA/HybF involved in hydrogenase expression
VHELALCEAIAERAVQRAAGRHVDAVEVQVGEQQHATADSMQMSWQLVTAGTELDGSELRVALAPGDDVVVVGLAVRPR